MARSSVLCSSSGSASVARGLNWAALQGPRRSGQPEICNTGHFLGPLCKLLCSCWFRSPRPLKLFEQLNLSSFLSTTSWMKTRRRNSASVEQTILTIHLKEENQHQMCVPSPPLQLIWQSLHFWTMGKECWNKLASLEATLVWNSAQRLTHKGKV